MSQKSVFFVAAVCCGVFATAPGSAAPQKDNLVMTGMTDSKGFTPTLNGNPSEYFYATTVPAGSSVADTIPIQFDLYDTASPSGDTYTVTLKAVGQVANNISFDAASFSITEPTSSMMHYAYINTSALAPGDYHANVQIDAKPSNGIDLTHSALHLLIHVINVDANLPNCYVTDSSGLLLSNCAGQPVNTGGEFLVVSNQKKITATNPGQFYFNFVWTNLTGSPVTFSSLALNGVNVVPQGANSVHVLIYDGNSFTASFDDVNNNGTPCGQTGAVCKSPVTVAAGQTLWLTWHLAYQWLGSPLWPDIPAAGANGCGLPSPHGTISVSALLQNAEQTVSLSCNAGANGQNIK